MNLPEPSGSSPPEKPPGMNKIWESARAAANCSTDWATSWAVRLRTTITWGRAPAASKARAVSYSQLVPGKAGISTLGLATRTLALRGPGWVQS